MELYHYFHDGSNYRRVNGYITCTSTERLLPSTNVYNDRLVNNYFLYSRVPLLPLRPSTILIRLETNVPKV